MTKLERLEADLEKVKSNIRDGASAPVKLLQAEARNLAHRIVRLREEL